MILPNIDRLMAPNALCKACKEFHQMKRAKQYLFMNIVMTLVISACLQMNVTVAQEVEQPHIFLFLSDAQNAADNGCYGNPVVKTPNIDQLAAEGMRFDRFFAAGPLCGPSRTSICTGMIPSSVGCWRNHGVTDEGTKSIVHYLNDQGYRCVIAGKNDVHPQSVYPFDSMKIDGNKVKLPDFLRDHLTSRPDQPLCLLFNTKRSKRPFLAKPSTLICPTHKPPTASKGQAPGGDARGCKTQNTCPANRGSRERSRTPSCKLPRTSRFAKVARS